MSGAASPLQRPWLIAALACALAVCIVSVALNHPMFVDDPYQIAYAGGFTSVSYTHLTLPTNREV